MNQITCAFTGHRPKSFPWRYNESAQDCLLLKNILFERITELVDDGITNFLSGMAQGTDQWAAEIVLKLREKNGALNLRCILPCEHQESKWNKPAQERYHFILNQADETVYVGQNYTMDCMLKRNRYMVDHASTLLAVYNGSKRSGTGATVRYAQSLKRKVIIINPVTRHIILQ